MGGHTPLYSDLHSLSVVMENIDSDHSLVELRVSGLNCLIVLQCTHACMHAHIYMYTHTHAHAHMHARTHTRTHAHTHLVLSGILLVH